MGGKQYDVLTVGAGPAGSTAAILLAQKGHRVVLVDRLTFPRKVSCAGWLNSLAPAFLDEMGVDAKALAACGLHDVTFHRADFSQAAKPAFTDTPAYLIDRTRFDNALVTAAVRHGVDFISGCGVRDLKLRESSVVADLVDGRTIEATLLVLASGRGTELLERVGLAQSTEQPPMWSAQVDSPLTARRAPKEPRIGVVLGLDDAGSFGLFCLSRKRMSVGVNWVQSRHDAAAALVHLCRLAAEHQVVPLDLSEQAKSAELVRSPAAVALDMESHVGKHTLVIGDAGGFISVVSNEGIYPGMWSAQIAVEVAVKALGSVHSQDQLMTFDSAWRMQMANYIRPPHTDIQFLLPLIFTNQPMADRMGAAFFHGENI